MNVLSFDIEEWCLNRQNDGPKENYYKYEQYLDRTLALLDRFHVQATFFCLGEMGRFFPEVVRKIQERGHEIGCHSNSHRWLNKMTLAECFEDTRRAIDSLEQCVGERITSYRAPAFSIGKSNIEVIESLVENGITRDSSLFPAERDYGGYPDFGTQTPCIVEYKGIRIKEFPICTIPFMRKQVAYSGGGYFRFFPLNFIKRGLTYSDYAICYFHIADMLPGFSRMMSRDEYEHYFKEAGTIKNRAFRFIKSNIGKRHAFEKMSSLIGSYHFESIATADMLIDWTKIPVVRL